MRKAGDDLLTVLVLGLVSVVLALVLLAWGRVSKIVSACKKIAGHTVEVCVIRIRFLVPIAGLLALFASLQVWGHHDSTHEAYTQGTKALAHTLLCDKQSQIEAVAALSNDKAAMQDLYEKYRYAENDNGQPICAVGEYYVWPAERVAVVEYRGQTQFVIKVYVIRGGVSSLGFILSNWDVESKPSSKIVDRSFCRRNWCVEV